MVREMKGQLLSRRISLRGGAIRPRQRGEGQAWLIFHADDRLFNYQCFWMGGHCDDHLIERAQAVTHIDAVALAAARTPRARIRLPDHVTYWARSAPTPQRVSPLAAATERDSEPGRSPCPSAGQSGVKETTILAARYGRGALPFVS